MLLNNLSELSVHLCLVTAMATSKEQARSSADKEMIFI